MNLASSTQIWVRWVIVPSGLFIWDDGNRSKGLISMLTYTVSPAIEQVGIDHSRALRQLIRSIILSQGQFCLILAHCNSPSLRQKAIEQLQKSCPVKVQELCLDHDCKKLYSTIAQKYTSDPPDALMITGLESVYHLNQLLVATNLVREEFRKFPFPLILWVTDEIHTKLIRLVPDFFSWAANGIEFVSE